MNNRKKKFTISIVWIAIVAIAFSACDILRKDSVQDQDEVDIINNEVYITSGSSGIIDLQGMVQTYGSVKVQVSGQPTFGKLDSFNKDLLKYTPNSGFNAGKDGFGISIYTSSNDFIRNDSVRIIVKNDSTGLPCGLYAMNDTRYNIQGPVEIDVLSNDLVCGVDKSLLEVTVQATSNGTAEVLSTKKIRYTPRANFTGDIFTYRILKPENLPSQGYKAQTSYGIVLLKIATSGCKDSLKVADDHFMYTFSTLNVSDTIRIHATANDQICRQSTSAFQITVIQAPAGKIFPTAYPPYDFNYILPSNATTGFKDFFKYRICVDDVCKEGEVRLDFN